MKLSCLLLSRDGEVLALGRLPGALGPEGRVRENNVVAPARGRVLDGVPQPDVGLDPVQVEVHERHASRARYQILAEVGLRPDALRHVAIKRALRLVPKPLVGADEEPPLPTAGSQMVKSACPRVGLHAPTYGLDEDPGREVLARALFPLCGGLLQEPLVCGGLHVDVERGPLGLVDERDELLQIDRVVEAVLSARIDVAEESRAAWPRARRTST